MVVTHCMLESSYGVYMFLNGPPLAALRGSLVVVN
jgi:hypothetical protein